jgi:uncharacterized membrane protein
MNENEIKLLADIRKEFGEIKNANTLHKEKLSALEKLAVFITEKIGTMGFFFIIFIWTVSWLGWNVFGPSSMRFDPFPGFVLWLFISNLIQLHLMPLIMIGQNIQGKHSSLRAEYDFQTNRKAEREIEAILLHLENQQRLLLAMQRKLDTLEEKRK